MLLDGVAVRHVTAFDTDEGWVDVHCLHGHTGHPGKPHVDPDHPDIICMLTLYGKVEVVLPEGVEV